MKESELENKHSCYIKCFCNKIHKFRILKNLSLHELAERSGLPLKMLEALERGVIPEEMLISDAYYLAEVFQCEMKELFQ